MEIDKTVIHYYKQKGFYTLRTSDLDAMNPAYSCVTCSNTHCKFYMKRDAACPEHELYKNLIRWFIAYHNATIKKTSILVTLVILLAYSCWKTFIN